MAQILYLVKDKVKVALGGGRPLAVNDVQVSTLIMNMSTLRQQRQAAQANAVNTISEVPVSETVAPEVQNTPIETPTMATPVQDSVNMNIPTTPENTAIPEVAPVMPDVTPVTNEAPAMDTPTETPVMETPVTPIQDSVNMEIPTAPESAVIPEVAPVMPDVAPVTNETPVMDTPTETPVMDTPATPVQDSVIPTAPESPVIPEVEPVMSDVAPVINETPVMDTPTETPVGVEIIENEQKDNALLKELESIHVKYNEQRKMIDEEEEKEVNALFQRHSEEMIQKQNIIQEQLKNAEAVTEIARQTQENLNKVNAENVIPFPGNTDVGANPVQGDAMTLGLEKAA